MDSDLLLILGLVLGGLAIPSFLSAFSDGRRPVVAAALFLLSVACIWYAAHSRPGGYSLREVPDVFFHVIARLF